MRDLRRGTGKEDAITQSEKLKAFNSGQAVFGRMLLHRLGTEELPKVEQRRGTLSNRHHTISKGHGLEARIKYSLALIKAWGWGERYCLVDFQNAVMLRLTRTLRSGWPFNITLDIVFAACNLPMRQGG